MNISAPLLHRALSLVYEALLLAAVLWFAGFLFVLVELQIEATPARIVYQTYLLLVAGIYFVWQWLRGQTLPMKTWRLQVLTRGGHPLSARHAVARYLFATAGLGLLGFGFLWALFDPERQFLHDRLAGTRIISF